MLSCLNHFLSFTLVMRCYTCDGKKNSDCTKYEVCKKDEEVFTNVLPSNTLIIYKISFNTCRYNFIFSMLCHFKLINCSFQSCETKIKRNGSEIKKKCKQTKDCKATCKKNEQDCTLCCVGDLCNKDQGNSQHCNRFLLF